MVARRHVAVFAAAIALGGCYDLERLEPGPESNFLPFDDFEDGDAVPSVSPFGPWRLEPFNPGIDMPERLELVQGHDSDYAYVGVFELNYPGGSGYSGMNLGSPAAPHGHLEARVFRTFHFSARFVENTPFPNVTEFYVQLGCDGAPGKEGVEGPFWIEHNVELGPEWRAQSLSIDAFNERTNDLPVIDGGDSACLAVVDSIRFVVSTNLERGEAVTGSLTIDDVYFE